MTFQIDHFIVTHRKGVATLHKNPTEQCNLDDTKADKEIDEFDAEAMLIRGDAKACKHCGFSESG